MKLIEGKNIAEDIKKEIAAKVKSWLERGMSAPHLASVLVGDDSASETYVQSIERVCREVGFIPSIYKLPAKSSERELLSVLDFLNADDEVDGYILQLPLPDQINTETVVEHIALDKDVDCMNPANMGNMSLNLPCFIPATPYGTMLLLERSGIKIEGKNCVVVGRSNIVGKPLAMLLSQKSKEGNATVTICHSHTQNLPDVCREADVLFVAVGQPEMITAEYVKPGAVVFDIGLHWVPDAASEKGYRVCGDVKFDEVAPLTSKITPVPGGVGKLTNVALLLNVMKAYELHHSLL